MSSSHPVHIARPRVSDPLIRFYDARSQEGFYRARQALTPPYLGDVVAVTNLRGTALVALSRLHGIVEVDRAFAGERRRMICWPLVAGNWGFRGWDDRDLSRPVYRWRWL